MDPTQMLQGWSRETGLVRDAEGRWFHDGQPLEHPNLVHAFDCWIERAEDGRYCLKNDINWAYFTLQGPPFFVRSLRVEPDGTLQLRLSNDRWERLRPGSLRLDREGALYCDVSGGMVARFDRHAAMLLEPLIGEDEQGIYVRLDGTKVRPEVVADPLLPLETLESPAPR